MSASWICVPCAALILCAAVPIEAAGQESVTRPPAIPLVTANPYFSLWSFTDHPADSWVTHWTGRNNSVCLMVRIDGKPYRVIGHSLEELPKLSLTETRVLPTRTVYRFEGGGVRLAVTFTTPLLPDSLDLLARPASYIAWSVRSADGSPHAVAVYLDNSAELCVNTPDQEVTWGRMQVEGLDVLRMGSAGQPVLQKKGDDLRIDWGYVYLASPRQQNGRGVFGPAWDVRGRFAERGDLPADDDLNCPRQCSDGWPVQAFVVDAGSVGSSPREGYLILAYDDIYSIEYFQRKLPGYWRRNGATFGNLLRQAAADQKSVAERCAAFDDRLMADLTAKGGAAYASICALAYRQVIAAHTLTADIDGTPLMFPKENFSNGCISTVDVIYPSAPIFLYLNTRLLEALLTPVFEYTMMTRWRFPFAPHDLGTYPKANGQVYGGGELNETDQMPVEESGNMIILTYALCLKEQSAAFALRYWRSLSRWAGYLREKGLDPENQLCTDDFTGHLAHNTNLSVKAIVALGCYGKLCAMAGKADSAASYLTLARQYAARWESMARDGDHYRLAFDRPGTWSMKYNLVWDELLGLGLFPPAVRERELAYYKTRLNRYGLPLDNRAEFTKPEWMVWAATMDSSRGDFDRFVRPIAAYLNATPDRVPFSDWYETVTAKKVGFQARSVLGGLFIRMLKPEPQTAR